MILTTSKTYTDDEIWALLAQIPDPEIPVITIEELGVLRNVEQINNEVVVTITPTYTGCPAMKMFEDDILKTLKDNGIENGKIKTVFSPAWTTDWIPESAKEKLREYGIAPPVDGSHDKGTLFGLKTNGRIESILMSLPPFVQWHYNSHPQKGSEEEKLVNVLKSPKKWV